MEAFFGWPVWLLVILQHFHSKIWVRCHGARVDDGLQWEVWGPSQIKGQNKTKEKDDVKFLRACFDRCYWLHWVLSLALESSSTLWLSENMFPFTGDLAGKVKLIEPHRSCFIASSCFRMNFSRKVITFKLLLFFALHLFFSFRKTQHSWVCRNISCHFSPFLYIKRLRALVCNIAIWWLQSYMDEEKKKRDRCFLVFGEDISSAALGWFKMNS